MARGRVYESVLYVQLERVVGAFVIAGTRPVAAADSRRLAAASILHIDAALTPQPYRVPDVTGNPQQGETLTATTGVWNTISSFTYQWQRCDAAARTARTSPARPASTLRRPSGRRRLDVQRGGDRGQPFRCPDRDFGRDAESPTPDQGYTVGNKTYGGAMASTWLVLRLSCKPRSPVGLVKHPETNASADHNLALAA